MNLKQYCRGKCRLIIAAIVIFHIFVIVSKVIYNKMIDEEHFLHIAKGEVEVAMMKRADLNKNVAQSVKQYVEMEGELMHRLIELSKETKSGADARRILAIEGEIQRLIASLDLLVMRSPQLRSKGPYIYMMETFRDTENEVLSAIERYNARASEFNMFIYKIPYNIVAKIYDFKKAELFKSEMFPNKKPDLEM
ncbi:MAG: LemA family protein [Thermodesulfovibrionales bacterium]|nr:LemA family protein [Thermodesulfovibrionales bacterium]